MLKNTMITAGILLSLAVTGCGESQTCDFTFGGKQNSNTFGGINLKTANFLHNKSGAKLGYLSSTLYWKDVYNNPQFESVLSYNSTIKSKDENSYHLISKQDPDKHMILTHYDDGEVYGYSWHVSAESLLDNLLYKCNDLIDQYVY